MSSTAGSLPPLALDLDTADDTAALEADVLRLFDECAASLARYVRGCGLEADAADDVVQNTFIALFRHLRLGRPRDNLRSWLFTVAHRLAVKHRTRTIRQRAMETPLGPEMVDAERRDEADPETLLNARRTQRRLQSALRALPERHRQCLLLRAEGLRYREIADVLGISLGAVAKAMAYAVLRLSNVAED